ncbi:hypothetical protein [Desulfogranum japonicum]|uniref:hypothetical protein n=1 Tax=Desulfogranum japonicum TaxID=231447 RepID=UPI000406C4C9|nr:hypothetical protein [Desulfogranum japonicum]
MKKKQKTPVSTKNPKGQRLFGKVNMILFVLALLFLGAGYYCLMQEPADGVLSLTVAPIILVICYLILFPLAILYKRKEK